MAEIVAANGKYNLVLSEKEFKELELSTTKEYEISKAKKGVYVLLEKDDKKPDFEAIDRRIFELIAKKNMSELVVGKFEKFLNAKELSRFNELVKDGFIEKFKLSDRYKKPIYRISKKKEKQILQLKDQNLSEREKTTSDGFFVFKNEEEAKKFSEQHCDDLKSGSLKGLKSFDGNIYFVESATLERSKDSVRNYLRNRKSATLDEIAIAISKPKEFVRAICEFMKDDGELAEKRKDIYCYIE